jgi:hypothetical protein
MLPDVVEDLLPHSLSLAHYLANYNSLGEGSQGRPVTLTALSRATETATKQFTLHGKPVESYVSEQPRVPRWVDGSFALVFVVARARTDADPGRLSGVRSKSDRRPPATKSMLVILTTPSKHNVVNPHYRHKPNLLRDARPKRGQTKVVRDSREDRGGRPDS